VFEVECGLCVSPASGCTSSADWLTLLDTAEHTSESMNMHGHFVLILCEKHVFMK
jgi:hypothetical protein